MRPRVLLAIALTALISSAVAAPARADDEYSGCTVNHAVTAAVGVEPTYPYVKVTTPTTGESCTFISYSGHVGWECQVGPGGRCTVTVQTSNDPISRNCQYGPKSCTGMIHDVVYGSTVRVFVFMGSAGATDCPSATQCEAYPDVETP